MKLKKCGEIWALGSKKQVIAKYGFRSKRQIVDKFKWFLNLFTI